MGAAMTGYSAAALKHIREYQWPGNVRQLENVIERACALAIGSWIDVSDLPKELQAGVLPVVAFVEVRPLPDVEGVVKPRPEGVRSTIRGSWRTSCGHGLSRCS
jgi:DNA-binding NtrC family response regulator